MSGREQSDSAVSIAVAAQTCSCSTDVIRNDLRAGLYPGARQLGPKSNGAWSIPLSDLIRAGRLAAGIALGSTKFSAAADGVECDRRPNDAEARLQTVEAVLEHARAENEFLKFMLERLVLETALSRPSFLQLNRKVAGECRWGAEGVGVVPVAGHDQHLRGGPSPAPRSPGTGEGVGAS